MTARRPARWRTAATGPAATAAGLAVLMACGIGIALVGAVLLDARDYTVYAAFSGLLGILVLGPAAALEQEVALRGAAPSRLWRTMLGRIGGLWGIVTLVLLLVSFAWGRRLLGGELGLAAAAIVLGAPVVFVASAGRGVAVARRAFLRAGSVHLATAAGMVAAPLLLRALGMSWLEALLVGAVAAWLPALAAALAAALATPRAHAPAGPASGPPPAATSGIQVSNLLVLANLLAVPVLLRWHVEDLGAVDVADVQLLVNISRLTTTLVLGFTPLVIGRVLIAAGVERRRVVSRLTLAALAFGAAAAVVTALLAEPAVELISGRTTEVPLTTFALACAPVLALCPAIVLTAAAVVGGRYRPPLLAWGSGLLALVALTALPAPGSASLMAGVLAAAALPLAVLGVDAAGRRGTTVAAATVRG